MKELSSVAAQVTTTTPFPFRVLAAISQDQLMFPALSAALATDPDAEPSLADGAGVPAGGLYRREQLELAATATSSFAVCPAFTGEVSALIFMPLEAACAPDVAPDCAGGAAAPVGWLPDEEEPPADGSARDWPTDSWSGPPSRFKSTIAVTHALTDIDGTWVEQMAPRVSPDFTT